MRLTHNLRKRLTSLDKVINLIYADIFDIKVFDLYEYRRSLASSCLRSVDSLTEWFAYAKTLLQHWTTASVPGRALTHTRSTQQVHGKEHSTTG